MLPGWPALAQQVMACGAPYLVLLLKVHMVQSQRVELQLLLLMQHLPIFHQQHGMPPQLLQRHTCMCQEPCSLCVFSM